MRIHPVIAAIAIVGLGVVACGGEGGGATKVIVLGGSLCLTGPLGAFGAPEQKGLQQAVSEINANGGVDVGGTREKLKLVILDNRSDPNLASQQTRTLVLDDNVVALLGGSTPPITIPESLVADQQRVPLVTSLTPVEAFAAGNPSGWKYAWDFFFNEKDQASSFFKVFNLEPTNRKVALFTDTEPDGVAERPLYKEAASMYGYDVVGDYTFPVGTTDYSAFINDAKAKGADDLIAQMTPADGITLWKQIKALGYAPKMAVAAKAGVTSAWPQGLGQLAEGSLSEAFWSPAEKLPATAHVQATLGRQFSDQSELSISIAGYTMIQILADALSRAGSTDPAKLNAAIGQTNKRYPFAPIDFTHSHTQSTPHLVTQWIDGRIVQILPQVGNQLEFPAAGLKAS
jgi:branched-chain amino acid transport system substrate-binding protein